MDDITKAYIEKNIADLMESTSLYNYAYVNGLLGALLVSRILVFRDYDEYYNQVKAIYDNVKPEESNETIRSN